MSCASAAENPLALFVAGVFREGSTPALACSPSNFPMKMTRAEVDLGEVKARCVVLCAGVPNTGPRPAGGGVSNRGCTLRSSTSQPDRTTTTKPPLQICNTATWKDGRHEHGRSSAEPQPHHPRAAAGEPCRQGGLHQRGREAGVAPHLQRVQKGMERCVFFLLVCVFVVVWGWQLGLPACACSWHGSLRGGKSEACQALLCSSSSPTCSRR